MFLNILITLFLLGPCLGEQKEPASFISFLRPNIPLPYKYNPFYDYSIEKSETYNEQTDYFRPRTNILKSIQYAPLNLVERSVPGPQILNSSIKKVELEPKIIEPSKNKSQGPQENFIQYIEGHNIVPLYRYNDDEYKLDAFSERNKLMDEIDDENLVSKLQNQEIESDEDSLEAVTIPTVYIDYNNQNLQKSVNPDKFFITGIERSKIVPVFNPYVKVPRLHLNIARSYNFARLPMKASLMGYQINTPKQRFVKDFDLLVNEKSFMYPVNNNHYIRRTL